MIKRIKEFFKKDDSSKLIWIKCPMCLNMSNTPMSTLCGHMYCLSCIYDWCKDHNICPICKKTVNLYEYIPVLPKEMKIDFLNEKFNENKEYQKAYLEYKIFKEKTDKSDDENYFSN
ncbi:hypothetical protein H312_00587 [Anncaliia algerae PRA339]|uniref:RING-type E3 ubiquitin transferase n=1 Tax=Anncaliia algerae PRA339 TaxID=1288291 RepID=A0A059F4L8_9MICR|nr:hypothetical protein H312_00587 [Anncaliia algerae PRA339]